LSEASSVRLLAALVLAAGLIGCAHAPVPQPPPYETLQDPNLIMVVARYEENQGNWEEALKLYSRLDTPYAWLARARIYYVIEDNTASLAELQKVIDDGTYLQEALEMRIRIHARGGNWDMAIKDTEALSKKYPENVQIKINLANIRIITGDYRQAKAILKGLIGKGDDSIIHYTTARACIGERDFTCAKESLRKTIDTRPEFIPAYLDLARIHALLGELSQAEGTYLKLLDVEPFSNEAHLALVEYYIDQKRYKDAIEHLKSVLETNPDPLVLRKLIVLDLQEGRFEDALNLIRGMQEMTDDDRYYLALAYAGLERYEEALLVLRDIPLSGKMGCDTTMVTSSILKNMDRNEESVKVLEDAWKNYADLGTCNEIGYQLATELDAVGRRDDGLRIALKLLEKDPQDPIALNFVGYVWADRGMNLDKAYTMIRDALEMKPDDPYILDSMAWVLYKMGRSREALTYIEKALNALKDDPTINEHMGDILKSLGQTDRALDFYLKSSLLNRSTNNDLKDKINRILKPERQAGGEHKELTVP